MPTIQKTRKMFRYIKVYTKVRRQPPTIREIGEYFDMSSSASVHEQLRKMEARGWICRSRRWRGIEIVEQERKEAA